MTQVANPRQVLNHGTLHPESSEGGTQGEALEKMPCRVFKKPEETLTQVAKEGKRAKRYCTPFCGRHHRVWLCGGTWEIVKGTGTGTLSNQLHFCWSAWGWLERLCTLTHQSSGTYHRLFGWYCDLRLVRLWPDLALSVTILHFCFQTKWQFNRDNSGRVAIALINCARAHRNATIGTIHHRYVMYCCCSYATNLAVAANA